MTAEQTISKVASLMGKRGWKARIEKYGLEKIQENMREVGLHSQGRPRMPDGQVKPNSLYQRERRARLRAKRNQKEESKL